MTAQDLIDKCTVMVHSVESHIYYLLVLLSPSLLAHMYSGLPACPCIGAGGSTV